MARSEFENLVGTGQLTSETFDPTEFEGLVRSGRARLNDARGGTLAPESRFDLAYNAAHALSLGALRWHGYRPHSRYLVFQLLPLTIGLARPEWRTLAKCHSVRNEAEYEGVIEMDDRLVLALIRATEIVETAVIAMAGRSRE